LTHAVWPQGSSICYYTVSGQPLRASISHRQQQQHRLMGPHQAAEELTFHTHTHTHTDTHTHTYRHTHTYTHTHTDTHTHTHRHTHQRRNSNTRTEAPGPITCRNKRQSHPHTHKCTHKYTHTQACRGKIRGG